MLDTEQQQAAMEALDAADVAVEISDARGEIHWVNEAFARMTGWSIDDAVGRTPRELLRSGFHPAEQYAEMWDKLERGAVWRGELVSRGRDDRLFRQVVAVAPVGGSGSRRGFVAVRRDVTAQIRAEQSHRALLDAALDAVLIADLDTARFVDANRAAQEMFGYSLDQLQATTGRMLCTPGQDNLVDAISAELNEHGVASYNQVRLRKADGREFWGDLRMGVFEVAGARSYVTTIRDVSDRVVRERELERSYAQLRETQAKLVHAGKLAAIGQLAAGVAHEINNPASYAMLTLHLALEWVENAREGPLGSELGELQQMLEESLQGIRQITAISRDLRVFARIERDQRTHVRLREVVEIAARMVRGQIKNDVRLELDLMDGLELLGDAPKLTQVMMNLLVNAAHALEQGRGGDGRIRVVTREVDGLVEIEVEDNGPGIPTELQDRVFEPFFTTKPSGVGTGLGLSVCAEIVRAHEGVMSLTSEPGRGTRFTIRLPMSPSVQAETGAVRGEIGRSVGRA